MQEHLVSIIITTKNEDDVIGKLLRSIKKQTYRNLEIIEVDNASSDQTKEIAFFFTKKVFDKGPERSAQRNFGAKKALGKYLFFLDADMELSARVVADCVLKIESSSRIGALAIAEKSIANSFWEKVKAYERSFYNLAGDRFTDAARFFRKNVFNRVGGYDETLTGPEDWAITESVRKAKFDIERINSVIFHYERIPSLYSLLKKKYYYGLKSHAYLKKQKKGMINAQTIYFLRPVFYKNWQELILHPILTPAMIFVLGLEMIAGGLGYLKGKYFG